MNEINPLHRKLIDRFISRVDIKDVDECWTYLGRIRKDGYGDVTWKHKHCLAHRISWMIYRGRIPDELKVLHTCDNRKCVNPNHLFLGTQVDNIRDMFQKGRQVILRGSKKPGAKLSDAQVEFIRSKYVYRKITQYQLAEEYGVTQPVIGRIVRGEGYKRDE